jgi:hypothetical protein
LIQALIEEGSEKRAQLLDQFISQHLQAYLAAVPSNQFQAADKAELARGFGKLLAKITSDMLSYERAHKVETNWNGPEEEQEVCRLTSQMGRDYYLAPEATRRGVASKYVDMFSDLPMPLEELALEEEAVQGKGWREDMPIEERRAWIKISKSGRPIKLETRCGPIYSLDASSHPARSRE